MPAETRRLLAEYSGMAEPVTSPAVHALAEAVARAYAAVDDGQPSPPPT